MRNRGTAWKATALLAALCVGAAHVMTGQWLPAASLLALTVWCLTAKRPAWGLRSTLFLSTSTAFAALGVYQGQSVALLLSATVAALAAWDLAYIEDRLSHAVSLSQRALLQRSHVPSLVVSIAGGLTLALMASLVRFQLSFAGVIVLALILVLALGGIPGAIRQGGRGS